jgi:hypothetical protein
MSTPTIETQAQLIARLQSENEALKAKANRPISFKVSEKGAVSVYGLGRFPVTLYSQQMEKLLSAAPEIRSFMAENKGKLTTKE